MHILMYFTVSEGERPLILLIKKGMRICIKWISDSEGTDCTVFVEVIGR